MWAGEDFVGAKLALLLGEALLAYRRDDVPGLPFPGLWDLPGGGREGAESPEACVLRELEEEFGLSLSPDRLDLARRYPPITPGRGPSWFFLARARPEEIAAIRFGSEGQGWALMPVPAFLDRDDAVPYLQERVAEVLRDLARA